MTALGLCAEALRNYFCAGQDAVLLKPKIQAKIYDAVAALGNVEAVVEAHGPVRTETLYKQWVKRLATKEYADELILLAVAMELSIRLVVIPYTPQSSDRPWVTTSYGPAVMEQEDSKTIYLGNNDVHYVYLSRDPH